MREIKFRVVNNGHIIAYEYMNQFGWFHVLLNNNTHYTGVFIDSDYGHKERCDRDQFTGILDNKKNEIYERDIVKYQYTYYKKPIEVITDVYWNYHGFYIRENRTKLIDSRALMAIKRDGEIIGNIYETPELLKKR